MRKSNEEFQAEIFRRSKVYRAAQVRRRKIAVSAASFCFVLATGGFLYASRANVKNMEATNQTAMEAAPQADCAVAEDNADEMVDDEAACEGAYDDTIGETGGADTDAYTGGAYKRDNSLDLTADGGVPKQSTAGIRMTVSQNPLPPDAAEITVTVRNDSETDFGLSAEEFHLFRLENGERTEVPYKPGGDYFIALGAVVPAKQETDLSFSLADHYALPLAEGDYEIETEGLTAAFTVSADAKKNP